jgi:hypothetical protein
MNTALSLPPQEADTLVDRLPANSGPKSPTFSHEENERSMIDNVLSEDPCWEHLHGGLQIVS